MKKDSCKYFNGFQNQLCDVGVDYVNLAGDEITGIMKRLPCIAESCNHIPEIACSKFIKPTKEELAAHEKEVQESVEKMKLAYPLIAKIKKAYSGKNWQGVDICPVCNGKIHLSHASYNGHVWGNCETTNCLSWME